MTKLEELIGQLALAEGPDRELDAEIHCIVNPDRVTHKKLPAGFTMVPLDSERANVRRALSSYIFRERGPAPHYTASIDAAMALVPLAPHDATTTGKWDWQLEQTNAGLTISARVGPQESPSFADTPAIALCIAALRARSEDKP